jgi:N-acetyl-anhydromuramyl-L-alanine amidase AmpD
MTSIYGRGSLCSIINIPAKDFFAGDPSGITIHYTADNSIVRTMSSLKAKKLSYHFIIDRNGDLYQTFYLDRMAAHAGKALWANKSPNRTHLSVAIISWGLLDDKKQSWTGIQIDSAVKRGGKYWDPASASQEKTLMTLLKNLMEMFDIEPDSICGHDECCIPPGRKADPGHVLLMTTDKIRAHLKRQRTDIT